MAVTETYVEARAERCFEANRSLRMRARAQPCGTTFLTMTMERDGEGTRRKVLEPGYVSDLFSSFYPLGVAAPSIRNLGVDLAAKGARRD